MNPWDIQYADDPAPAPAQPAAPKPWQLQYGDQPSPASSDAVPSDAGQGWGDVAVEAATNLLPSAWRAAQGVGHAIAHPIETGKNLFGVAVGGASKLENALGIPTGQSPEKKAQDEAQINALKDIYAQRYGSEAGFKKALSEDPFGVLMDASTVLSGGGTALARAPGMLGRAGEIATTAGNALNPVNAAGRLARAGGTAAAEGLGLTTGAGALPIETAFESGARPGGSQTFLDNVSGRVPLNEVVPEARAGIREMRADRSRAYLADTAGTKSNWNPIDMRPLVQSLAGAAQRVMPNGFVKNQEALNTLGDMQNAFERFQRVGLTHSDAVDNLKQAIGEIRNAARPGSLSQGIASDVYHHIGNELRRQNPGYDAAMRNYSGASDEINNVERTFSLGQRAAEDTALRKLQSVMRNNVSTNYGNRTRLMDVLAARRPELPAALAGQSLNSWSSRGLSRIASGVGVGALGMGVASHAINPAWALAAPFFSPRAMGYGSYAAGRAAGIAERALARAGINGNTAPAIARAGYYGSLLADPNQDTTLPDGAFQ